MKIQQLVLLLMSFLAGAMVYAMDWQRQQDKRIADLDKINARQTVILERQVQINEKMDERRMYTPTYRGFSIPTKPIRRDDR